MEERLYLAALHFIGISHKKLFIIFEKNQRYKEFFMSLSSMILKDFHFNENQIQVILERKEKCDIYKLQSQLDSRGAQIIMYGDEKYPKLLEEISNPPYIFYLRGEIDNAPKISVVGSRKITQYGKDVISKIIPDLSKYFSIVSGGAAGCDTIAHKVCLESDGKTLCIVGTGIDVDYPVENKILYQKIVEKGGGVLSIFPVGEIGNPYNFPVRNEIVAGLSLGTLIIEAQEKSGTLITAGLSLDLGRDLFSVPGDIFRSSYTGSNGLIQKGMAKLVMKSSDILEEYNIHDGISQKNDKKNVEFTSLLEQELYGLLYKGPLTIDEIITSTCFELGTISPQLSLMEIQGFIHKGLGGKYRIC